MRPTWSEFLDAARKAIVRTPVEISLGFALAICASLTLEHVVSGETMVRCLAGGYLALVLTFSMSALHALDVISARTRWIMTGAYVLGAGTYGALMFDVDHHSELWRYATLAVTATAAFSLVPMARGGSLMTLREHTWNFNARIVNHITLCGGVLGLALAGLGIAFVASSELLSVDPNTNFPGHVFSWLTLGLGPWMICAGLPNATRQLPVLTSSMRVLGSHLLTYLALPLVSLYLLILYAYNLRILGTGIAPKNMMSPLTIGAAALVLGCMWMAEPLRRDPNTRDRLCMKVLRLMPTALIPLLPMTAWAVIVRIDQYGWTEFRYLRLLLIVCLGVIFALSSIAMWRGRRQPFLTLPVVFVVAGIFASTGPWGAASISEWSQQTRLLAQMSQEGLVRQGVLVRPDAVTEISAEAYAHLRYLERNFGPASLNALLPTPMPRGSRLYELMNTMNYTFEMKHSKPSQDRHFFNNDPLDIKAPGRLHVFQTFSYDNLPMAWRSDELSMTFSPEHVILERDSVEIARAPLTSWKRALLTQGRGDNALPEAARTLDLRDPSGRTLGRVHLEATQMHKVSEKDTWRLTQMRGSLNLHHQPPEPGETTCDCSETPSNL